MVDLARRRLVVVMGVVEEHRPLADEQRRIEQQTPGEAQDALIELAALLEGVDVPVYPIGLRFNALLPGLGEKPLPEFQ